jgi:hypothetical protein
MERILASQRPPSPEGAILARAAQRLSDAELATLVAMGREQRGGSLHREMTEIESAAAKAYNLSVQKERDVARLSVGAGNRHREMNQCGA